MYRQQPQDQAPAPQAPGIVNVSRRGFVKGLGGLALGMYFAPLLGARAQAAAGSPAGGTLAPNAFVRIGTDGSVTVISKHLEMGQGSYTGLATILAEELDADWSKVVVQGAPADRTRYANLAFPNQIQGTGGSSAMANSWPQLREAGATARAMLVSAAAARWKVDPASIQVEQGVVKHPPSGRSAGFGELAEAASKLPVPREVALKQPKDFKLVGRTGLPRKDTPGKVDGSAIYTQDLKLPGMLVAVAAHPPRFGGKPGKVDASKAKAIPGVVAVVAYEASPRHAAGVAVLAKNTWIARQGRDALQISWDEDAAFRQSTPELFQHYRELAAQPGDVAATRGDAAKILGSGGKRVEAVFEFPYLAHAPMEPINCMLQLGDDGCQVWNGEQFQTLDQLNLADELGLKPEQVKIEQLFAGGSFGRRAHPHSEYLCETAAIARAAREQGIRGPIKLVRMREDDMRAAAYRPMTVHRVAAAIGAEGQGLAWQHRIVAQTFMRNKYLNFFQGKIDPTIVGGASDMPYAIPHLQVEQRIPEDNPVDVLWFRSVEHTHTAFATETVIDELAAAAGKDPYAFRRELLTAPEAARYRGVLDLVAQAAGWDRPLAPGKPGERRGRGLALQKPFGSYVAHVAEVTVQRDGRFKVDRLVAAVDCGIAINPDVVKAQLEGGAGFGLSYTLHGAITLKDGVVEQSNFNDYPVLRMNEMPPVETHILASNEAPSGIGEPGVCTVAPAVANALAAATGVRLRTLPIDPALLAAKA